MSPSTPEPVIGATALGLPGAGPVPRRLAARWQRHRVWLGPHGLASRGGPAWGASQQVSTLGQPAEAGRLPLANALFARWCAAHAGSRCELRLSGHLEHSLLFDAPAGASTPLLQGRARQHWARFHGPAALGWPVAVDATQGRAAAFTPAGLDLAALRATAREHGVRLVLVQPAWVSACTQALAEGGSADSFRLAVVEPGLVTWIAVDAGRCVALARQAVDEASLRDGRAWLALLHAAPLPGSAPWRVLGHGAPAALHSAPAADPHAAEGLASPWPALPRAQPGSSVVSPDFADAAARPGAAPWLLCAAACAALAASVFELDDACAARDAAKDRVAAVQRGSSARPGPLPSALPRNASAAGASRDADANAAQRIAARLHHPWPALFTAGERAAEGQVRLLTFIHEPGLRGASSVQWQGIAADDAALARFVDALADSRALREVQLRRREPALPPATGLRFEVVGLPAAASVTEPFAPAASGAGDRAPSP